MNWVIPVDIQSYTLLFKYHFLRIVQQYHKIKANFSAHSSVLQNGGWGEILHVPFFCYCNNWLQLYLTKSICKFRNSVGCTLHSKEDEFSHSQIRSRAFAGFFLNYPRGLLMSIKNLFAQYRSLYPG